MRKIILVVIAFISILSAKSQDSTVIKFKNQYKADAKNITVKFKDIEYKISSKDSLKLLLSPSDSFMVEGKDYNPKFYSKANIENENIIFLHKKFTWTDLLTPMFYIIFGG
ncbi:MAG: hypothetical protein ABL929_11020, partial [Ferruginibacter sp.]